MFADVNLVCIDSYTMADTRWVKKNAIYSIIRWRNLLYSIYIDVYNKLFGTYVDWYTLGTMEHIAQIKMRGEFFFAIAFESHSLYTGCIVLHDFMEL